MKAATLALIAWLAVTMPVASARIASDAEVAAALEAALHDHPVPAMAAVALTGFRAGAESVRGVRRIGGQDAARPGDRWHLGSDSKAMTATLVARLVERGTLSWSTRLDQMLPELAATMDPAYRDVTLVDLLSHRSGLPENVGDESLFRSMYDDLRALPALRFDYVTGALKEPPVVPPHGARSYSNTGYILAAVIAERATRRPFEELMQREVFSPLGMRAVSYEQRGGPREPAGHVDGRVADRPDDVNPAMFAPAGGGRMALADWARFCLDQMQGERGQGRLLEAQTYRFLHTAQDQAGTALGWGVKPELGGHPGPVLTHSGSDGNWYAVVVLFPANGDGVLVVANAAESMQGDAAVTQALKTILQGPPPDRAAPAARP